jgi:lipopolysaccharide transport system permease protein
MEPQVTYIQPKPKLGLEVGEIWRKRELLFYFIWRNFKIRYKQTAIGAAWALFRPLILMIVFTLLFNRAVGITSGSPDIPYPLFSYIGLLFWTYFAQTTIQVGDSMVANQNIFTKIYFPRLIIPLSATLTGLIDFFIAAIIYIGLMFYYGIFPTTAGVLLFFPMLLITFITVLGLGSLTAALNVRYRDVSQALPFIMQVLLFLTPVIYPVSSLPENLQWILFLNPITGVIEVMRATLLGLGDINIFHIAISISSSLALLIVGIRVFKREERIFADVV